MNTPETFEYAIKKDVRNNPIVREVDRDRHREMWRAAAVSVFLVSVLLFWAFQHFELLRHGYRVEQMQRDRAAEAEANRHLKLEIDTLRALDRGDGVVRVLTGRPLVASEQEIAMNPRARSAKLRAAERLA